jgi:hypothetical protein
MPEINDQRQLNYYGRKYSLLRQTVSYLNQIQVFSGDAVLAEHDFLEGSNTRIYAGHIGSFWAPPFYSSHVWRGRKASTQKDSLQTSLMLYNRASGEATFEKHSPFTQAFWFPSKMIVSRTYTEIGLNTSIRGVKMALPGRSFALKIDIKNKGTSPQDINLLFLVSLNTLKRMETWYYPSLGWNWNLYPSIDDYRAWYVRTSYEPEDIALFSNFTMEAYFAAAIQATNVPVAYELDNWTINPNGDRNTSIAYYFYDHGWLRNVSRDSRYTRGAAAGLAVEIPQLAPGETYTATLVMAVAGTRQGALDQITSLRGQGDLEAFADERWAEKLGTFIDTIPTLETPNSALKKIYHNSALAYLLNRWDSYSSVGQASFYGRSTALFPWLTGTQTFLALAEPVLWRDMLLRVLQKLNFKRCRAYQPIGSYQNLCDVWYAASRPAIIQAVYNYIAFSGDTGFLDEIVNDYYDITVLETIKDLALYRPDGRLTGLVDFGGDSNLYEFNIHCNNYQLVGKYTHKIPSMNADYVHALRLVSELLVLKGENPTQLDNMADNVSGEINSKMWDEDGWSGTGWFSTLRPYENPDPFPAVAVFHLLDIPSLITDEQRQALLLQLENEFISDTRRFTSLPMSWRENRWCSRADWHGPGLYSGEVGLMLTRLFQNGRKDLAAQILWDDGGDGTQGYKFLADIPFSHQAYSHSSIRFPNDMDLNYLEGVSLAQAVLCGMAGINASVSEEPTSLIFRPRLPDIAGLFPFEVHHFLMWGNRFDLSATSPSDIQLTIHLEDNARGIKFSYDPEEDGHQLELVFEDVAPSNIFSVRVTGAGDQGVLLHAASDENGRVSFGPFQVQVPSIIEFPYAIGEAGMLQDITQIPRTVTFLREYQNPVVFAQPLSRNENDTSVIRITQLQPRGFTLFVHEAPNKDGIHVPESVSYLVLEAGNWELESGTRLIVGKVETAATVGLRVPKIWKEISFDNPFSTNPAVLSQVQSNQDPHWVKTRQKPASLAAFFVALEEEEVKTTPHGNEFIGWLAIEPGSGNWSGHSYEVKLTGETINHLWQDLTFDAPFERPPLFLASLATYKDANNAALRYKSDSLSLNGIKVRVEEDQTADTELTHPEEAISYLAIQDAGTLSAEPFTV